MKNYLFPILFLCISIFWSCKSGGKSDGKTDVVEVEVGKDVKSKSENYEGQTLFKEFKYGQTMDEIKKTGGYEDCSKFFDAPALCIQNVKFLENDYEAGLIFQDNKLRNVCLYREFDENAYHSLPVSLQKNGFQLVILQDDKQRIDLLQSARKSVQQKDKSSFLNMVADFENRMLLGNDATMAFLELKGLEKPMENYGTSIELLLDLPSSAREITMSLITEDDGKRYMALNFSLASIWANGKKEKF